MLTLAWAAKPPICPHCLDTGWCVLERAGELFRTPCKCEAGERKQPQAAK